jgi:CelD/BcsL family acetyltransferase involved in cellulose biosynthesis
MQHPRDEVPNTALPKMTAAEKNSATTPALSVVVVTCATDLAPHVAAWKDLARHSLEPNPFYESWMLLPALRAFGHGKLLFALVYTAVAGKPLLCGFFPLERKQGYKGLPLSYCTLWKHLYCVFAAPLLRTGWGQETLAAFLDWVAKHQRVALVEFPMVPGQGPFQQLLVEDAYRQSRLSYVSEAFPRALCEPHASAENYLESALATKRRKELRRQEKRLGELGLLEYRILERAEELPVWVDAFLELEASGWKGQKGDALDSRDLDRAFFRDFAAGAFACGQLMMLGLFLGGRPIALKCNLRSGHASFAFKIAFDEQLARFSPGVLLELQNIRVLHETPALRWMDSCAIPDHFMINRLWTERRLIQTVLLSTGRASGDLVVSLLPLLRWLKRCFSRRKPRPQEPSSQHE